MSEINYYELGTAFPGVIGRTIDQSEPAWPAPVRAKEGAPNVLFIVLDDVGFGQLGCYGAPIKTPNMDRLAENGLLYNNMHTTAVCSPSRACILTGRNHHSNGMASVTNITTGYPGRNGWIPFENGFLSEMLLQHGYNTYALGKWHLTVNEQSSAAGPYERWPLGRGFERFYGFLGGETDQYYPKLTYDNHQVEPPKTPEDGYHLTEDLVDKAISFIADAKQVAPEKPFFMYFCPGAGHNPHHVPSKWADEYEGCFDDGWDAYRDKVFAKQKELGIIPEKTELSDHDPSFRRWDKCSDDEKRLYARMMEVYAGFIEHTDHHIGRLFDFLKKIGEFENTLIMLISDNGASAQGGEHGSVNKNLFFNNLEAGLEDNLAAMEDLGGPETSNDYPSAWAWAGNTPFRRWKLETYRGGVSDPFVVHWPAGIPATGEVRTQYAHVIDMVPTVLEALELEPPRRIKGVTQSPLEGVSLAESFACAAAKSKHLTQYFDIMGHRAIYHDGWRAVCPWPSGPDDPQEISAEKLTQLDANGWELYHVCKDFTEMNNVADENREKLIEMIATWYVEAGKYNVLPVDGRRNELVNEERPQISSEERSSYTYYPGTQSLPAYAAVNVLNRSHSITADVEIPDCGAEGMIIVHGSQAGGYGLYIKDNQLCWVHNYVGIEHYYVKSLKSVPLEIQGRYQLRFEFEADTGSENIDKGCGVSGHARLFINRLPVGRADVPKTTPITFGTNSYLQVGRAHGSPVCPDYEKPPFEFNGTIHSVTIEVFGEPPVVAPEAQFRIMMSEQ